MKSHTPIHTLRLPNALLVARPQCRMDLGCGWGQDCWNTPYGKTSTQMMRQQEELKTVLGLLDHPLSHV